MPYRNPIIPGHNPDPTLIRDGSDYFLVTSTFEYFPGLPIYHSTDLINWKLTGHALDRPSQLNMRTVESGGGIFAPSLRKWKGRYYLACTACYRVPNMDNFRKGVIGPRGFYVWTDDIRKPGSWSEPVYFDTCGIDQDLFFDDDDRVYLSMTTLLPSHMVAGGGIGIGVYVLEIDLESGKSLTRPKLIRQSHHGSGVAEGSHIFKKDGVYYLLTAEGGTEQNHQEWIFKSTQGPFGPWEEPPEGVNPILFNGEHREIQQTGHLDLVQGENGDWWTVFLGVRNGRYDDAGGWSQLGRETFLAPVEWKDGWPLINRRLPIGIEGTDVLVRSKREVTEEYPFQPSKAIPLGWYFLRTPMAKDWSLDLRPGSLALWGTPYTINVDECPAAVFQKQTTFIGVWEVKLDFAANENEEAGIVVWWSRSAYASLTKVSSDDGPKMKAKWRDVGLEDFSTELFPLRGEEELTLRIEATPTHYALSFREKDGQFVLAKGIPAACIIRKSHADSARNVGTHFGLFAQGTNQWPCLTPAFFRDVKWTAELEGGV